jgi:transcriptional regulator with XRE-family HTH domain
MTSAMADNNRDSKRRGRPFSLDAFMRLLKAAGIPEYSSEALALIRSALQMRLPPPQPPTGAEVSRLGNACAEDDAERIAHWASRIFGKTLGDHRRELGLSIGSLAAHSGIESADIWRLEHGLSRPPQGETLLRLIKALEIPFDSPGGVEFVSAAGLPYLNEAVLREIAWRLDGGESPIAI